MSSQAKVEEITTSIRQVEGFIDNVDKIKENSAQHSPSSNCSSVKSEDSGLDDGAKIAPGKVGRKSSRLSTSSLPSPIERLEQMIASDEWIGNDSPAPSVASKESLSKTRSRDSHSVTELSRTLVTSASLKSYIDLLSSHHRQTIAAWLYGNTNQVLGNLLRFPNANVYCSESEATLPQTIQNGIGHAVKLALLKAYGSEFHTKGWRCFVENGAPVVYVSPALHFDVTAYLASEFGIVDVVVLQSTQSNVSEIEGRIDYRLFEEKLTQDLSEGKKPLMLIGVVGSTILGQNDMISKILEIKKNKHDFWLHITGQAIAALAFREPHALLLHVLSQVDSLTIPLGQWLGVPSVPVVTLYTPVEGHKPTYREKLNTLPWWITSSYLTSKRMVSSIETAYHLSKLMLKGLSNISKIDIIGMENPAEYAAGVYRNKYTPPTVLVFRYHYDALEEALKKVSSIKANETEGNLEEAEKKLAETLEYNNSLNSWLYQGLASECRQLGIEMSELQGQHGHAFRFSPLEYSALNGSTNDDVQLFVSSLIDVVKIIESTVSARINFENLKTEFPTLTLLPIKHWAGVGAVCYIPSIVKETNPSDWNDSQKQQISHLNLELVHQLRSYDSAFSSGHSDSYGVSCVKFGMLSDANDLSDLVKMVADKGKEIENSQKYLDSLAEIILHGIEAANEHLKKENETRLQNEGVIRQLPLMGSLVNWFSPMAKDNSAIKGRSFNLKTGEIQPTELIFKVEKAPVHNDNLEKSTELNVIEDQPIAKEASSDSVSEKDTENKN